MRKKLLAVVTVLTLMLGFGVSNSASATASFSPLVTVPYEVPDGTKIALDDTHLLTLFGTSLNNGFSLRSTILSTSGTLSTQEEIFSISSRAQLGDLSDKNITQGPDGTIALTWSYMDEVQQSDGSRKNFSHLMVAYTQDGIDWSSPIQILETIESGDGFYCMMFYRCGYNNPVIDFDRNGTLSVLASISLMDSKTLVATSTRDGANWGSKATLDTHTNYEFSDFDLTELPQGGFVAVWGAYADGWVAKYSTMSGTILNFWKRGKTIGTYPNLQQLSIEQTSPTQMSMFTTESNEMVPTLSQRVLNLTTGAWGTGTVLATTPQGWNTNPYILFDCGRNWHCVVGYSAVANGQQLGWAYAVELQNSTPGSPYLVANTNTEQAMTLGALKVNHDDSITAPVSGLNAIPRLIIYKNGTEIENTALPVTGTTQIYNVRPVATKNGNVFFLVNSQAASEAFSYLGATAPVPSANPRLSGTSANGKTLTAVIPTFGGFSPVGATSVQWYSCSASVATALFSIPVGCTAIAKATTSKFKVTSKQKNKYLAVAVVNRNDIGTTTLFSPTTKKTK